MKKPLPDALQDYATKAQRMKKGSPSAIALLFGLMALVDQKQESIKNEIMAMDKDKLAEYCDSVVKRRQYAASVDSGSRRKAYRL